jgi:hypothetical protein
MGQLVVLHSGGMSVPLEQTGWALPSTQRQTQAASADAGRRIAAPASAASAARAARAVSVAVEARGRERRHGVSGFMASPG